MKNKPNKHRQRTEEYERNIKNMALNQYIGEHVQEHNFDRLVRTGFLKQERD